MSKVEVPAEAREIPYEAFARPVSETAANAHNRLYGKSGAMKYRVVLAQSGGAQSAIVVTAETGDEAADMALQRRPGWKVTNVAPATDEYRATDDFPGEAA